MTKNECIILKFLTQVPIRDNHYWVISIKANFFEIHFEITIVFFKDAIVYFFEVILDSRSTFLRSPYLILLATLLLTRWKRINFVKKNYLLLTMVVPFSL